MKTDTVEDIAFLLYGIPIILGLGHFLLEILSNQIYSESYLIVTRNPFTFILSLISVSIAMILHLQSTSSNRNTLIAVHARRMRIVAIIIIGLSLIGAVTIADSNTNTMNLFLTARFPILFTSIMFLQSSFIQIPFSTSPQEKKIASSLISIILIIISPGVYYLGNILQLPFIINFSIALIFIILGTILFIRNN